MARPPKMRPHYNKDAQFLLTLAKAIEQDKTRPLPWRKQALLMCTSLATHLLTAPVQEVPDFRKSHKDTV